MNSRKINCAAIGLIAATAGIFTMSSCVNNNYDLTKIDKTVQIAENGLSVPLGSTESLTLEKLLDEEARKYIKELPDGRMAILSSRKDDFSNRLPDLSSKIKPLSTVSVSEKKQIPLYMPDPGKFEITFEHKTGIEFIATDIFPTEVKSVDRIDFRDTYLNINLMFADFPDLGVPVNMEFDIMLPEKLKTSDPRVDSHNILHISEVYNPDGNMVPPIKIDALDMKNAGYPMIGILTVKGKLTAENPHASAGSINGKKVNSLLELKIPNPQIERIEGKADYKVSGIGQNVSLDGMTNLMKGDQYSLDVINPHIELIFSSNTGIPVKGDITIVPFVGSEPKTENTVVIKGFEIPASVSGSNIRETKIWISDNDKDVPAGYEWLQAGLSNILKIIPDYIQVTIDAGSNTESEINHIIEPDANYVITLEHILTIPMQFGENLNVALKDTLKDVPSEINDILNNGKLIITGNVETTLPIDMELTLRLLDSKNNEIPMENTVSQNIMSCRREDTPAVTVLNMDLTLKEGTKADDISSIELTFNATSPVKETLPIKKDSYLKAKLSASLPNGFTVDMNDSGDDKNQDDASDKESIPQSVK